jgi:hypothetical protein
MCKSSSLGRDNRNIIIENQYSNQGSVRKSKAKGKIADKFKSMKNSIHNRFLAASKRYISKKMKFEKSKQKFGIGTLEAAQKAVRKTNKISRNALTLSERLYTSVDSYNKIKAQYLDCKIIFPNQTITNSQNSFQKSYASSAEKLTNKK